MIKKLLTLFVTLLLLAGNVLAQVYPSHLVQPTAIFDANSASTMFTTHDGTTLAGYGDPVGRWSDALGLPNPATQSTAGSRPIRATAPITGVRNRWERSEPVDSTGISTSNLTFTSGNISGFSSEAFFGDNTLSRTLLKGAASFTPALVNGEAYRFSIYVKMSDGLAPVVATGAGGDFVFIRNNAESVGHTLEDLGGGVYRVTMATWTQGATASVGFRKNVTSSNRTFWATGFHLQLASEANLAYQKVVTQHEVYEQGVPNRDYLWFNGTNQWLIANGLASVFHGNDTPFTIITVERPGTVSAVKTTFSFGYSAALEYFHTIFYDQTSSQKSSNRRAEGATTPRINSLVAYANTPQISSFTFKGQTGDIFTNGSLGISNGAIDVNTMGTFPDRVGIGAAYRNAVTNYFDGDYYALLIFNKALTEQERQAVEGWAGWYYKIGNWNPESRNWDFPSWVTNYSHGSDCKCCRVWQ